MPANSVSDLVAHAKQQVTNLSPQQVADELQHSNVVLIDLRESNERDQKGMIPGAIHAPRGMLEFYADSASPYHRAEFDPARRLILYCASGGRSALAASTLQGMGYKNIAHLDGGLNAWNESGHPIEHIEGTN